MIKTTIIKEYLKNPKKNYLTFDIKYTKKESKYLDNLNINKSITFDHYGNIDNIDNVKLDNFLKNIGDNQDIDILINIVKKILIKTMSAYKTKYCWLTIRVTMPTNAYDIPRWHKDGKFFKNRKNYTSKFITILKGPGTLFIKNSKYMNDTYYKFLMKKKKEYEKLNLKSKEDILYNKEIEDKYKKIFVRKFKDLPKNQLATKQGLIFITGDHGNKLNYGLLHSEPKKVVPRFFISILPGTEDEIKERMNIPILYTK
jgi:hypothetical protein